MMFLSISASALAEEPSLSVLELPPTEGSDQAQVAVKWSGELPVTLQAGLASGPEGFEPIGKPVVLTDAMSLLPHPDSYAADRLRWRVLNDQRQTIVPIRSHSQHLGWQPDFISPGFEDSVLAATIHNGHLVIGGRFTTVGDLVVNHIARWDGSQWSALSGPIGVGVNGTVWTLTVYNGELIAGGQFTRAGGLTANFVASWDGSNWNGLSGPSSAGISGWVFALTVYDGGLFAGGSFTSADGVTVNHVARWNGVQWGALSDATGTGVDRRVWSLTAYEGELIVGGEFTIAGGVAASRIARWNGSRWADLPGPSGAGVSSGVNPPRVLALTVHADELIVGGRFSSAGGIFVNNVARWDGSQWLALTGPFGGSSGTGVNNEVWALTVYNGEIIAGGTFTRAGGVTVNRVARWDDTQWASLGGPSGTGLDRLAYALAVYNDELIAGGDFAAAGGISVNRIGRWDGTQWASLTSSSGTGMDTGIDREVRAVTVYDGELIAAGFFTTVSGIMVNRIARWNGSQWASLDGPEGTGVNNWVLALTVYNGELIAGGAFSTAGGVPANKVARWDGSRWASLDGPSGSGVTSSGGVSALTVYEGELIVGGQFTSAGGVTVNQIARWDGAEWRSLDGPTDVGVAGEVNALAVYNGELIAGGSFFTAGGVTVNRIARWNGSEWAALSGPSGTGLDSSVRALIVYNGELIAGGSFTQAGGVTVNHIARWNDSEWASLDGPSGTGLTSGGVVSALTVYEGEVVAGGGFSSVGGVTVNSIARWSANGWDTISGPSGTGVNSAVRALTVYNNDLYAGGTFTTAGGVASLRVGHYIQPYTIGGEVTGLAGGMLVLQNNGGDDLVLNSNGAFTFSTPQADGSSYEVTVLTQPTSPSQTCSVSMGTGSLAGADVVDVDVTCTTDQFTVGGDIFGLSGSGLMLQNNNGDDLSIGANGPFTFPTALDDLSAYSVTVLTQPGSPSQTCAVANGSGNLAGAEVTNVEVTCVTDQFTVGGTVSDLEGSGLVLQNNGGDDLAISANGSFTFSLQDDSTSYDVTVLTQPDEPSQTCTVVNGTGALAGENVINVEVTCITDQFTVGGTVTGLEGDQVVLQNNGGDDQTLTADGGFTFSSQDDATDYLITVATQPTNPQQICNVINGSGTLAGADIEDVEVICGGPEIFNDRFEME